MRKVKIYNNLKWIDAEFKDIKCNDIFKLYELNGDLVHDSKGKCIFKATSDVFLNENNIRSVEIDSINGDI